MFGKSSFSSVPICGDDKKFIYKSLDVIVNAFVTIRIFLNKIVENVVETVIVVLTESTFHLVAFAIIESTTSTITKGMTKSLSAVSNVVATLSKIPNKILSVLSTSTATIKQNIGLTLSYLSTSISTITTKFILGVFLSVTVNSAVTIKKALNKIIAALVSTSIVIQRNFTTVLSVISVTINSIIVSVFQKLGASERYTFLADTRDRLAQLFKIRNVLANKKQGTIKK